MGVAGRTLEGVLLLWVVVPQLVCRPVPTLPPQQAHAVEDVRAVEAAV